MREERERSFRFPHRARSEPNWFVPGGGGPGGTGEYAISSTPGDMSTTVTRSPARSDSSGWCDAPESISSPASASASASASVAVAASVAAAVRRSDRCRCRCRCRCRRRISLPLPLPADCGGGPAALADAAVSIRALARPFDSATEPNCGPIDSATEPNCDVNCGAPRAPSAVGSRPER